MTASVIRKKDLWCYGALAVPVAFAGFPLYVLAPDYYATEYGVSLSLLGFLLLALRLFDAIQDPLIGMLSDRYRHASIWFMGVSSLVLCAGIYGLFNVMWISPTVWFSICIGVAVTAYSVLSINLNALGGLWAKDPVLQTSIAGLREGLGLIGLIIAVSLPGLLKRYFTEEYAYFYYCLVLFALMMVAWLIFRPWLRANMGHVIRAEKSTYLPISQMIIAARSTQHLLVVFGLSTLASSIPAVLVIFFIRDLLGAENLTGLFLLLYFLAGAASMPLWKRASAYFGKYRSWMFSMLLAIASFVWAFFLNAGDIWQYAAICVFSGIALGADLSLPPAILAEHIHRSESENRAATQYAFLAIVAKLSLALASAIALPLLGKAGFVPAAHNSEAALFSLSMGYALIPCALKLAAAAFLWCNIRHMQNGALHENHQNDRHSWSSHHA